VGEIITEHVFQINCSFTTFDRQLTPHEEAFSGKFSVRLPKSLHRDLVTRAEQEGVSLNQYITAALGRAVELG